MLPHEPALLGRVDFLASTSSMSWTDDYVSSYWEPLGPHPSVGLSSRWHLGASLTLKILDDDDNDKDEDDGGALEAPDAEAELRVPVEEVRGRQEPIPSAPWANLLVSS